MTKRILLKMFFWTICCLVDIYNKAKKLHIEAEARRLVFVIETNKHRDSNAMEVMKSLFTGRHGAYITAVDEENIILVKELEKA